MSKLLNSWVGVENTRVLVIKQYNIIISIVHPEKWILKLTSVIKSKIFQWEVKGTTDSANHSVWMIDFNKNKDRLTYPLNMSQLNFKNKCSLYYIFKTIINSRSSGLRQCKLKSYKYRLDAKEQPTDWQNLL